MKGFGGVVGSKVSDQIEITVGLMASSALGEKAMNHCNPCAKAENPCGGKAGNPCNPCAKAANPCGGKR